MKDKTLLITGANRGLGEALVQEALDRGARRVYAAARKPMDHADSRVVPLRLDITNESHVQAAVRHVGNLDVLVNNAGLATYDDLRDRTAIEEHLKVNLFGPYSMMQAFATHLERSRGSIVNVLSLAAFVGLPIVPSYSISKAAALSLSQNVRALLSPRGIRVQLVFPGPIDTEMSRDFDVPKATPRSVAAQIFDGLDRGDEEIFPDAVSASLRDYWKAGAFKEMERQNASLVS